MSGVSRHKDVDPESLQAVFDVIVTRANGMREGLLTLPDGRPFCLSLIDGMTKADVESLALYAYTLHAQANDLPI